MDYKLIIALWFIFSASIIYWDLNRWEDDIPVSECHNATIQVYHDRPMCTACKLYCKIKESDG